LFIEVSLLIFYNFLAEHLDSHFLESLPLLRRKKKTERKWKKFQAYPTKERL